MSKFICPICGNELRGERPFGAPLPVCPVCGLAVMAEYSDTPDEQQHSHGDISRLDRYEQRKLEFLKWMFDTGRLDKDGNSGKDHKPETG